MDGGRINPRHPRSCLTTWSGLTNNLTFSTMKKLYGCGYWRGQPPIACSSCLTTWRAHPVSVHTKNIKNNNQTSKTQMKKLCWYRSFFSFLQYLSATTSLPLCLLGFLAPILVVWDTRYVVEMFLHEYLELLLDRVGVVRRKVKI